MASGLKSIITKSSYTAKNSIFTITFKDKQVAKLIRFLIGQKNPLIGGSTVKIKADKETPVEQLLMLLSITADK